MLKYGVKFNVLICIFAIISGYLLALYVIKANTSLTRNVIDPSSTDKNVIGFLPYWLLKNAKTDYSRYITQLGYFGLRIDGKGNILKNVSPQEEEPGWYSLESGLTSPFLESALQNKISLSLLIVSGSNQAIEELISDPVNHARNLVNDLNPILEKYKFSDVNLDIEYTNSSSDSSRLKFTELVNEVKKNLPDDKTLTVEIATTDVFKKGLIDPEAIGKIADYIVVMGYDYHSTASYVTGPVAPIGGAGISSEYDVSAAIEKTIGQVSPNKVILGVPLYGYEWETMDEVPRSAIIPNTGLAASNKRAENIKSICTSCRKDQDNIAQEAYLVFADKEAGDYHMIFYPDANSTLKKIKLTEEAKLGGIALWALGYEGKDIMEPLNKYKKKL